MSKKKKKPAKETKPLQKKELPAKEQEKEVPVQEELAETKAVKPKVEVRIGANEKVKPIYVEDEIKESYLSYAMSVIVGRALPDVRDGLKPVQRRILYAMNEMGLTHSKPYRKSAMVVGEVLGKYHPHGDLSVYDTMVRLTQDFKIRYPLIDGQGNFGSVDGDGAAAYRYTEARLAKISDEVLADIEKNTVDFIPNYDQSREEPQVLPTKIPNLLVNGAEGIAVGMATNIPPHNLTEVINGIIALIDDSNITIDKLMTIITGPDFPTGGYILGRDGIKDAYSTGRGSITLQAKTRIEEMKGGKQRIIVYEIPYQVNKARLIESIAELVRDKKLEGLSDIRDESDKDGMRIVIELKKDENPQIILNNLYKHTSLKSSFGVIMLALVDQQPQILNLKGMLSQYLEHRRKVIIRRTKFDLDKAERRVHLIKGLLIIINDLERAIKIIRFSKDAEAELMKRYKLTQVQVQAILDYRLRQLQSLEILKLEAEYKELLKLIEKLKDILSDSKNVLAVVKEELIDIRTRYGDERRTHIIARQAEINIEDLIKEEDVIVTMSHLGYVKRLPVSSYKAQKRGGKGITGAETKDDDFVEDIFVTTTKDYLMLFTNRGKVYWLKVYEIPEAGRYSKGKPIVNLIKLETQEQITAALAIKEFKDTVFVVMATKQGMIKKTRLSEFNNPRSTGIIALRLRDGDELIAVKITTGKQDVVTATRNGYALRSKESDIREIGRSGIGVKGMKLGKGDFMIGMEVVFDKSSLLTVTERGFGKRTDLSAYRVQGRGGKGLINIKTSEKTGLVIGIKEVAKDDEIMVMTSSGVVIRSKVSDIRQTGRSTSGVRLIRLSEGDKAMAVARLASKDEEE